MNHDYDIISVGMGPAGMAVSAMGFLSKRLAETWMMTRMKNPRLRSMATKMYRLFAR